MYLVIGIPVFPPGDFVTSKGRPGSWRSHGEPKACLLPGNQKENQGRKAGEAQLQTFPSCCGTMQVFSGAEWGASFINNFRQQFCQRTGFWSLPELLQGTLNIWIKVKTKYPTCLVFSLLHIWWRWRLWKVFCQTYRYSNLKLFPEALRNWLAGKYGKILSEFSETLKKSQMQAWSRGGFLFVC